MAHNAKSHRLSGHLQRLLFSPQGTIEGLLMTVDSKTVQVTIDGHRAPVDALHEAIGTSIEIKASADHSPKTRARAHPVYRLVRVEKLSGKVHKPSRMARPIRGVVASLHYAKHGEPNGVILKTGEFIHMRPGGMKKLKLEVGSRVVAHGETRMTLLRTVLIEAHEVNRIMLA